MNRSEIMQKIKSRDNKSTELRFRSALMRVGAKGYTIQPEMPGHPDLAFLAEKVAVFLDGCFWHGCEEHFSEPKTNRPQWVKKIRTNKERDARTVSALLQEGWKVFRIWEHDLKDPGDLKGFALRVARAADTADTCEAYTLPAKTPSPNLDLMACIPCGRMTGHRTQDLTGFGVYKEAECEVCLTVTTRIRGIALQRGGDHGDTVQAK